MFSRIFRKWTPSLKCQSKICETVWCFCKIIFFKIRKARAQRAPNGKKGPFLAEKRFF